MDAEPDEFLLLDTSAAVALVVEDHEAHAYSLSSPRPPPPSAWLPLDRLVDQEMSGDFSGVLFAGGAENMRTFRSRARSRARPFGQTLLVRLSHGLRFGQARGKDPHELRGRRRAHLGPGVRQWCFTVE